MAGLSSLKKIANIVDKAEDASRVSNAPRMSEALDPHVGKRLYITQADRTALDYPEGLLGGPGYVDLAGIDPEKYKDIAWAVQTPGIAKTMVGSMARNPEEAIWTNLIGSPEQHRSNKVVFNRILDAFNKAKEEGKLTPELTETINARLASLQDPKTGKKFFPEDVDITHPEFEKHTNTFHTRAAIADILGGKGVGGKKGSIISYQDILRETTDPLLIEAKTGDIGDRLFSLSGNIEHRPDLHPAFHTSLGGRKESPAFKPAPQNIVLKDFYKDFTARTGRMPTYYDLTRGFAPNVKITDEMLETLHKSGHKDGGTIKAPRLADGGLLPRVVEGYRKSGQALKALGEEAYNEIKTLNPMKYPRAIPDIATKAVGSLAGLPSDIMNFVIPPLNEDEVPNYKPFLGGEDIEQRLEKSGITTDVKRPLLELGATFMSPKTAVKAVKGAGKLGKEVIKEGARQIQTGEGILGKTTINPRMNIVKDPGGMMVGGEKELDQQLMGMKKTESAPNWLFDEANGFEKDPHAVTLNKWIDTKVRKYMRNQLGSKDDPILKAIDEGVPHQHQGATLREEDNAFMTRKYANKPEDGIAKTDAGKDWENKVDSQFNTVDSNIIKDILNDPNIDEARKLSALRMGHDLPVNKLSDIELIKQIPDERVHNIIGEDVTNKLGLNHVADVLYEDLASGRITEKQMEQMSIEKAIRRTAEYDAEKAKGMMEAEALAITEMPQPRKYDDGFKWVELKHPTDEVKTKKALESEGKMMGHCVGSYCSDVLSGDTKIFSLRDPQNKSHVTIELTTVPDAPQFYQANEEMFKSNPKAMELHERWNETSTSPTEYVQGLIGDLEDAGIKYKAPPAFNYRIEQVKGKQNMMPQDKYLPYVQDFVKNPIEGKDYTDIRDFHNTGFIKMDKPKQHGVFDNLSKEKEKLIDKEIFRIMPSHRDQFGGFTLANDVLGSSLHHDEKIQMLLKDFPESKYTTADDIIDYLKAMPARPVEQSYSKYYRTDPEAKAYFDFMKERSSKKAKGGSIDLEQEFKLRRHYG